MKQTLGILAHVDAGKTTLSERILYHTNTIRTPGRVDDGSAHMDHSDIERERGITVFSDAARISVGEHIITLIDTPGHADFSAETERAISAMDYALLVVSAIDGVQSHTETVWRLLRSYNVPTFIFINKTDAATADADGAFSDIEKRLSENAVDFSKDFSEALAEKDEELLDEFIETGKVEISEKVRELIKCEKIFPTFRGSALRDENIDKLISSVVSLMMEKKSGDELSAICYKVRREGSSRFVYLKINSGEIKVKDSVKTPSGELKIDEIRIICGEKLLPAKSAGAGEVCAV
ncbi:MAG: GTP-binding protein, partial [Oscillospiraceae bacterium]|nr:GTP-binding protein [Oscillospiraceae bacterium]